MRRAIWLGLLALVAGCNGGDGSDGGDEGPAPEATLVWGRGADTKYLDPARVTDGESVKVCTNLFDTLITFKPGLADLAPGLAESWENSEDGLTWTFHLREATFHDGTPVDAEAVKFSFLRQKDKDHPAHVGAFPYYEDSFKLLTDVRVVDARTVEVVLAEPFPPFEATMTLFSMGIQSPTAWASEGLDEKGKYKYAFHEKPVGSGPFRFVSWRRNELIVIEANDDYWGGRPGVDRVIFETVTDNAQRLLKLESGDLDIIDGVNLQDVKRVQEHADLQLLQEPSLNIGYLSMNCQKPPFDNPKVRQAVAFAVSKEKLRVAAYDGLGQPAVVPVPVGMMGRLEIEDRKQDIAKAKALLAEAGFPEGFETTLWCGNNPRPYMPRPEDAAINLAQDLQAIGIRAEPRVVPWSQYIPAVQNGKHDMCLLGWSADFNDPDNFLYVLLDKSNARMGSANNVSFYMGEEVSRLLTGARSEPDRSKRLKMYTDAQKILFDEVPLVPLMQVPQIRAANKRVKGYLIYPVGGEYLKTVTLE